MQNMERINNSATEPTSAIGVHPEANISNILNQDIQSSIGNRSAISVECTNGVVTLNGYFANKHDRNKALHSAIVNPSVCKVINNTN